MKRHFLTTLIAGLALMATADINNGSPLGYLDRGKTFYSIGYYDAAIDQLTHHDLIADPTEQSHFAEALAATKSRSPKALSHLEKFLKDYPSTTARGYVYAAMGNICLDNGEWLRAYDYYSLIGEKSLDPSSARILNLHKAVVAIRLNYLNEASELLRPLEFDSRLGDEATFYQGYIAYALKDYTRARELLANVHSDKMPCAMAPFYLCQISYMDGDRATTLSEARRFLAMEVIPGEYRAEAARMAGETLYNSGDLAQAIPYLEQYVAVTQMPQPAPLYILGMSLYDQGDYHAAIEALKLPGAYDNAMAQSALLTCGQAYYTLGELQTAMVYLDHAVKLDVDSQITEEAMYNYLIVKTEGGRLPFAGSADLSQKFLQLFPGSKYASTVAVYLAEGYMTDNDYASALESINKVHNPSDELLKAKLAALYALGGADLQKGHITEAADYLRQARKLGDYDSGIALECELLYGDVLYHQGKYAEAVKCYENYIARSKGKSNSNTPLATYDLGYALFSQGKYAKAAIEFEHFLKQPGSTAKSLQADAANRLGDCLYYQQKLSAALESYDRAARLNPAAGDYALYQRAMVLGYQGKSAEKAAALSSLKSQYPSSPLLADALLEQASTLRQEGKVSEAIATYKSLSEQFATTSQGRRALFMMSALQATNGRIDDAIETYKILITNHTPSAEATAASESFKELAVQEGRLDDYLSFISGISNAPALSIDEVEDLTYRSARTPRQLEQYLEKYPVGRHAADALITLVRDAAKRDNSDRVMELSTRLVSDFPGSSFAAEAWEQKAGAEMEAGKTAEALDSYRNMEQRASSASSLNAARMGQLKAAFALEMYDEAITQADKLLSTTTGGATELAEINMMKASALSAAGHGDEASGIWRELAVNPQTLAGAKSAYYLSEYYFENGDTDSAWTAVNALIESNTPQNYWLARGYILLSDLHRAKGEYFEAVEYLKVLRDNYPGTEPDIFNMIDQRLQK